MRDILVSETFYYTIEKSSKNLGSYKGKNLAIYFYCLGTVTIENTKRNQTLMISLIIIGVILVVAIVIFIIYYCIRKKRMQAMINQNVQVVSNNNNNYNYNYAQQQPIPNYPNNNMNMNINPNANNGNPSYTYNGYNNGINNIYS